MTDTTKHPDAAALGRWFAEQDVRVQREDEERLMNRFGDADERRWAADPEGPRVSAGRLVRLVSTAYVLHQMDVGTERPALDADDVRAALRQMEHARRELDGAEHSLIEAAREQGLTWKQIAACLRLESPQAAQQRFARLGGT